ncbi:protein-disulfide reductase DsbD family protein [Marinivivus vitaminiproducens]|uniref:protein-disulfide reductase DsbD family protein n=1 Tax=Marinivivus vitaminiproducens TaxID=3035935 RepID=UPI0027A9E409|nr:protein-disulfide reductase DsbD family protein [Geminicoccaceae bacterium SCSIO 64248]
MSRRLRLLALLAVLALPVLRPAAAESVRTDNVTAELMSEAAVAAPGDTVWVAMRQQIREGWHTYWRNPGDSGDATRLSWDLPEGVTAGDIIWPTPSRLPYGPLTNYGFKDEAWLLVPVTVPADWPAGRTLPLRAHAQWLVCAEICIPEEGVLSLDLPTGGATVADPALAEGFAGARAALPGDSPWPATAQVTSERIGLRLDAAGIDASRISDAYFFADRPGAVEPSAPQARNVDRSGLTLEIAPGRTAQEGPLTGVLVLTERLDGGPVSHAFEVRPETGIVPAAIAATADLGLWQALVLAFGGGLILNLMPCVFPVLAMKALALARQGDMPARERRLHGLAYGLGVVVSFVAIAGLLLALRAGGEAVGWGFQLQSPIVVLLLAWLLFIVGLSLSGLVALQGAFAGAGAGLAHRGGAAGAFGTGVLATMVATPCTAPLMAAALGYAMVQPAPVALAIFLTLGFGMALPMVLLGLFPVLGRTLPRPGPWMERFKQALAFPMYASAAWLVWVLSLQAGPDGVAAALAGMVLIAAAAWLWHMRDGLGTAGRRVAGALAVLLVVGTLGLVPVPTGREAPPVVGGAVAAEDASVPYSEETLARLRAEGRPVFLNLTAAWCITCQVNERIALSGDGFQDALAAADVAYLKGDWTNRDPAITDLLDRFGRSGVPLYVYFPGDGAAPVVLPQVLTEATVVAALKGA